MKISVILPSYNQGQFVEETLRSLISQDYADTEIVYVDGGSTDDTMAIVERYRQDIDTVICEPDKGQSDALRKGFEAATGDVLTWLNTDDLILPGTLAEVAETFRRTQGCEWVLGNTIWVDVSGTILRCRKGEPYSDFLVRSGILTACGPTTFFSRDLYERVGGVSLDMHYMMDTELWWRFAQSGARFERIKRYSWALRLHEDAKMSGHLFLDDSDPRAKAKAAERARVAAVRESYRGDGERGFLTAKLAPLYRAACSSHYLRSLYDSQVLKGQSITDLKTGS